ncbi:MAG TPA: ATP-binding cassette domain-containing protein, partial [Kineosporiaceae bacterium]|nr:ATP-binding cassette domain-containing protein [Kineosporiaceae bacterium]
MDSAGAHLDSIRSPGRGTGRTPHGTVEVDPRVPSAHAAGTARAPIPVVRTQFGRFNALTDLTVEMTQGEVFGYLGPNGAGKTTTIRLLLGLLRPTRGRVE